MFWGQRQKVDSRSMLQVGALLRPQQQYGQRRDARNRLKQIDLGNTASFTYDLPISSKGAAYDFPRWLT